MTTIDLTAYNALVNDDGSNTVGTLATKVALLLTPVLTPTQAAVTALDAAIALKGWTIATASTLTGAQNNWAPTGLAGNTYIPWNGAADAAFTGLAGGVAGQLVTIRNVTAAKIATFAHQSGSSSAGNKFKNPATSAPTPIAAGGWITYFYDGTDWILVAHEQGAWITPAFSAGDFTGNGAMTWTVAAGDISWYRSRLSGNTQTVSYYIGSSTVGGTPNSALQVKVPGGFTAAAGFAVGDSSDNGGTSVAAYVQTNGTNIQHFKSMAGAGNWAAATDTTVAAASIDIAVT
jgi:hypothetical protein